MQGGRGQILAVANGDAAVLHGQGERGYQADTQCACRLYVSQVRQARKQLGGPGWRGCVGRRS